MLEKTKVEADTCVATFWTPFSTTTYDFHAQTAKATRSFCENVVDPILSPNLIVNFYCDALPCMDLFDDYRTRVAQIILFRPVPRERRVRHGYRENYEVAAFSVFDGEAELFMLV